MKYGIRVKDVMITKPLTILPDSDVRKAVGKMLKNKVGSLVVVDKNNYVLGLITEGILISKVLYKCKDPRKVKVKDVMIKKLITLSEDDDIEKAFSLMKKHGIKRIPVIDEKGYLRGLVTETDLQGISKSLIDVLSEKLKVLQPSFGIFRRK